MPPEEEWGGDDRHERSSSAGGGSIASASEFKSEYFQTYEGERYLESVRSLIGALGAHEIPIEEEFLTQGGDPEKMRGALEELVHLGELSYTWPDRPNGGSLPRTFVRPRIS